MIKRVSGLTNRPIYGFISLLCCSLLLGCSAESFLDSTVLYILPTDCEHINELNEYYFEFAPFPFKKPYYLKDSGCNFKVKGDNTPKIVNKIPVLGDDQWALVLSPDVAVDWFRYTEDISYMLDVLDVLFLTKSEIPLLGSSEYLDDCIELEEYISYKGGNRIDMASAISDVWGVLLSNKLINKINAKSSIRSIKSIVDVLSLPQMLERLMSLWMPKMLLEKQLRINESKSIIGRWSSVEAITTADRDLAPLMSGFTGQLDTLCFSDRLMFRHTTDPEISLSYMIDIDYNAPMKYNIIPSKACSGRDHDVIFIASVPKNRGQRDVFRSFYGEKGSDSLFFIIGEVTLNSYEEEQSFLEEARLFGDIVYYSYPDGYFHLVKKVFAALSFFLEYCPNAHGFIKHDEDVLMDIGYMLNHDIHNSADDGIVCLFKCHYNTGVFRDTPGHSFYGYSKKVWPFERLPTYCGGAAYRVPRDAAERIFFLFRTRRWHFHDTVFGRTYTCNEDTLMTGFFRIIGGIGLQDETGIGYHLGAVNLDLLNYLAKWQSLNPDMKVRDAIEDAETQLAYQTLIQ